MSLGRAAGCSLAGALSDYRGGVPHNITHVGRMLFANIGCMDDYDHMVVWSYPLAFAGHDIRAACAPGGLIDSILKAAR